MTNKPWWILQEEFLAARPYKLDYDDEKHKYTVDGKEYPSVNKIIDKVFNREYRGDPIYGEIGTASARAIELDLREELDEDTVDDLVRPRLEAFRKWKAESGFAPIACELPLYANGVTGRLDIMGEIKGASWIIDNKCVKQLNHFTTKIQLAGYEILVMENKALPCSPRLAALQLKDDGSYHFEPYAFDVGAVWRGVMALYEEKTK